jgi:hypothetical protein
LADSGPAWFLWTLLCYVPPEVAFVIAGAKLAPRRPTTAAIVMAVLRFVLSLMTHVVGQHLAGNHVGITNYLHLFAESAELLSGAAYIASQTAKQRRPDTVACFDLSVRVGHLERLPNAWSVQLSARQVRMTQEDGDWCALT